jgi:hypothetical protein
VLGAVQVDHQMVLAGLGQQAVVEVDHLLVVAVHEVDLDPLQAPLFIERQGLVHLGVHRLPVGPDPQPDLALGGVGDQARHVDLGDGLGEVGARLHGAGPPLFLYQPSSISMYSRPLAAAKSM